MNQKTIIEYMTGKRGGEYSSPYRWGKNDWTLGRWGYVVSPKVACRLIKRWFVVGRDVADLYPQKAREYSLIDRVCSQLSKQNCLTTQLNLNFLK